MIGNSFVAFQTGSDAINYNNGDIPIAVGNFIGSTTADQIACAQGFGGSNIIRIYQYTGREKPNGFAVVAQFNGLSAACSDQQRQWRRNVGGWRLGWKRS